MRLPALALAVSLASVAPAAAAPQTVVVLVTGDENGHLLPNTEGDTPKGGAAETLGFWTTKEGHCAGKVGKDGAPACKDNRIASASRALFCLSSACADASVSSP